MKTVAWKMEWKPIGNGLAGAGKGLSFCIPTYTVGDNDLDLFQNGKSHPIDPAIDDCVLRPQNTG
jgi:hypothetical protein